MHWLAVGEHQLPDGLDWLSPAESERLAGMRFTKRRTEYLLRRLAGKLAVAALTGRPTEPDALGRVELLNRPTGAPEARIDGRPAGLEVSLTDRAGWAVCLAGTPDVPGAADVPGADDAAGAVGVDLELLEPRSPGFVRDFLTPAEQRLVVELPEGPDRDAAANLIWSAKESALKVLQLGLRADTRTVEVSLDDAPDDAGWSPLRVRCRVPSGRTGERTLPGWWRRDGVFLLTLAYERESAPPVRLLAGAELGDAVPRHSWLTHPMA